jgi:hypothetical protein
VFGIADTGWRNLMTPLIAVNAVLLTYAMVRRLRRRENGRVYFPGAKNANGDLNGIR